MVISERANNINRNVASNLLSRQETGILESIKELVSASLLAYPDEERRAEVIVQLAEHIYMKAVTSPLTLHTGFSNQLLISLLRNTDEEYHTTMGTQVMRLIEALYLELKSMKQDPFKKKVLNKLCNSITVIMCCSNARTCHELIKQ